MVGLSRSFDKISFEPFMTLYLEKISQIMKAALLISYLRITLAIY